MAEYHYDPYRSPYVGSIADLMGRGGDIQAQAALRAGDIRANAATNTANIQANQMMQSGANWGNALNQVGQTIASIPQQMEQQKRSAVQDHMTALALEDAKRKKADVDALDFAYKNGHDSRDAIINALPGHLRPTVTKQFADADSSAAKLTKLQGEITQANNEYLSGLATSVAEHNYDLGAAGLALQHARNTYEQSNNAGMVQRIDEIADQLRQNPDSIKLIIDGVIKLSPQRAGQMQTATHQAALETQSATTAAETARHNQEMELIQTQSAGRMEAAQKETARHNAAIERLRAEQNAQTEAAPTLTGDALKMTAHQYAMTGQLPPMGMGKAGASVRTAIINAAADEYKNLDLPSQIAAYKANQQSLSKLQPQVDAVKAFESTALKNVAVFEEAAKKVIDTGSPMVNKPLRALDASVLGGTEQTAFNVARQTVVPEFAKILNNPTLSGQLTDSARHEIATIISPDSTLAQMYAAIDVLKRDAANRRESYEAQIKDIQKRIATPPGGQAPPTIQERWERGPDGKLRKVGG